MARFFLRACFLHSYWDTTWTRFPPAPNPPCPVHPGVLRKTQLGLKGRPCAIPCQTHPSLAQRRCRSHATAETKAPLVVATCPDPLEHVWPNVLTYLRDHPDASGTLNLQVLLDDHPGSIGPKQHRT